MFKKAFKSIFVLKCQHTYYNIIMGLYYMYVQYLHVDVINDDVIGTSVLISKRL